MSDENIKECPYCGEEILVTAKKCRHCGEWLEKNNKYPITSIAGIVTIILITTVLLIVIFIATAMLMSNGKQDLYKIWDKNHIAFVNENGKKVFAFPINQYDIIGNFYEGRLFVGKIIREELNPPNGYVYTLKLKMLNGKGRIVRELPYSVQLNCLDDLPIMYKGIAKIYTGFGTNDYIYINRQGKEISTDKVSNTTDEILSITKHKVTIGKVDAGYGDASRLQYITHAPDKTNLKKKTVPCDKGLEYLYCAEYVDDNNNVVIKKQITSKLDNFYNGYITITSNDKLSKEQGSQYMDTKGRILRDEKFDWIEPFTRKLAFVQKGDKYGYINTKGDWIWSTKCTEGENCVFMYLGSFDAIKTYLNPPTYEYDENIDYD